jgi:hypothetical protein
MKDFCIKCTSPEQGQEIKAYIESLGIDTMEWEFCEVGAYYGLKNNRVRIWRCDVLVRAPIITLPEKPQYPCEMLVWDSSEDDALECIVVGV